MEGMTEKGFDLGYILKEGPQTILTEWMRREKERVKDDKEVDEVAVYQYVGGGTKSHA